MWWPTDWNRWQSKLEEQLIWYDLTHEIPNTYVHKHDRCKGHILEFHHSYEEQFN